MPRYRVTDGFCLGGVHGDVYPGTEVDLTAKEAAPFIHQGRLVEVEEKAKTKPSKPEA